MNAEILLPRELELPIISVEARLDADDNPDSPLAIYPVNWAFFSPVNQLNYETEIMKREQLAADVFAFYNRQCPNSIYCRYLEYQKFVYQRVEKTVKNQTMMVVGYIQEPKKQPFIVSLCEGGWVNSEKYMEVAVMTQDDGDWGNFSHRGLATYALLSLCSTADASGYKRFVCSVYRQNEKIIKWARKAGIKGVLDHEDKRSMNMEWTWPLLWSNLVTQDNRLSA